MPNKGLTITWVPNRQEGKALVTADLDGISIAEAILDPSDKAERDCFMQQVAVGRAGIDTNQVEAELQRIAAEIDKIPRFQPFPTDVLPKPVADFIHQGARALGCDESYIALPLLTMLAAAVGNSRCIRLKRTWCEPAMIWAVVVGESGTLKSPAHDLAMKPIYQVQNEALKEYRDQMVNYSQ